jgi:hypothetical protein
MSKKREELCDARIDTAVRSFLYNSAAQNISRYAAEGRKLQNLSEPVLKEKWVAAFKVWASAPSERPRELDDCDAELELRKLEAPYTLVEGEMELIKRAAKVSAENMTDEERDSLGEKIIDHHVGERGMKN